MKLIVKVAQTNRPLSKFRIHNCIKTNFDVNTIDIPKHTIPVKNNNFVSFYHPNNQERIKNLNFS